LNGITAHIHEAFVLLLEVYGILDKCAAVTNRAAHCVKIWTLHIMLTVILNFGVYQVDKLRV
jgi:hypothetical protein